MGKHAWTQIDNRTGKISWKLFSLCENIAKVFLRGATFLTCTVLWKKSVFIIQE